MGKRKKKELHPADQFRKSQRKRELKKNKTVRKEQRDKALAKKTPLEIKEEIFKLERQIAAGQADDKAEHRKKKLHEAYKAALAKEKELERKKKMEEENQVVIKGLSKIIRTTKKKDDDDEKKEGEEGGEEAEDEDAVVVPAKKKEEKKVNLTLEDLEQKKDEKVSYQPTWNEEEEASMVFDENLIAPKLEDVEKKPLLAEPPGLARPPGLPPPVPGEPDKIGPPLPGAAKLSTWKPPPVAPGTAMPISGALALGPLGRGFFPPKPGVPGASIDDAVQSTKPTSAPGASIQPIPAIAIVERKPEKSLPTAVPTAAQKFVPPSLLVRRHQDVKPLVKKKPAATKKPNIAPDVEDVTDKKVKSKSKKPEAAKPSGKLVDDFLDSIADLIGDE